MKHCIQVTLTEVSNCQVHLRRAPALEKHTLKYLGIKSHDVLNFLPSSSEK